jgi:hypothetical protein
MPTCITGNKLVEAGNYPSEAVVCMDCCTSRDSVPMAASQCLDPGQVVYLDTADSLWKKIPTGTLSGGYASLKYGILFSGVNTMDGKVGKGVVIRDNARIVPDKLTWNTETTPTNKSVILGLLDARSVKADVVTV